MTELSVNLNRIALLRNSRNIGIPSVIQAARTVIQAGAYGVTVHPRPDERHIKPSDVYELAELLKSEFSTIEYNIEGNPFQPPFMELVRAVKPTQCTLVPDDPNAFTSDHGWDLSEQAGNTERLRPVLQELHDLGSRVSLFIDPVPEQIRQAQALGSDRIELYTEPYATVFRDADRDTLESVFQRYREAAQVAQAVGLGVNAGHDLNLHNLPKFCTIPGILEVSIGHALTADALDMGLANAVKAYLQALSSAP